MMIKLFLSLLFIINISFALNVEISYGKENNKNYSIISINHDEPIECYTHTSNKEGEIVDATLGDSANIICKIIGTPSASFAPTQTLFFKFSNHVNRDGGEYGEFYVQISPKYKQKLFATINDLKGNAPITRERPKQSKRWQIIGYMDEIPFLSNKKSTGLNFPINIIDNGSLYMTELDLNRAPLNYEQGQDFSYFVETKKLLDTAQYVEAIKSIDDTLRLFPDTIFAKDLILYRIRALSAIEGEGRGEASNSDVIIDTALQWIKKYPADSNMPEVLYELALSYDNINFSEEARYYYERIFSEYPKSKFSPLAKMSLAETHMRLNSNPNNIKRLYAQAYKEAQDIDSASQIAVSWAKFNAYHKRLEDANKLLDAVYVVRPNYFSRNIPLTYKEIVDFANHGLYVISAKFGEEMIKNLDPSHLLYVELFDNIGEWYELGGDLQNAHRINTAFLGEFASRPIAAKIQARDDALLFGLAQNSTNEDKISKYDYIIQNYPNTQESSKALELKAEVLFATQRYDELFAMREAGLPNNSPSLVNAYQKKISDMLKSGNCKEVALLYVRYKEDNAGAIETTQEQKMPLFDCLYTMSLNSYAKEIQVSIDPKDLELRAAWSYRFAQNHLVMGEIKQAAISSRDALTLAKSLRKKEYYDIAFTLFDTLNDGREKMDTYKFLHDNLRNDIRNIAVNLSLLKSAQLDKNLASMEIYANEIFYLQNINKSTDGSPYADFALAQIQIENRQNKKANITLDNLLKKEIKSDDRQKALYLKGSSQISLGQSKGAKQSFSTCVSISKDNAWGGLCQKGLDVFK